MIYEQRRNAINKPLAKPLSLTAGILGLVQGIVWAVLSVLCICCYLGSIQIDEYTANQTDYYKIIYFIFLKDRSETDGLNIIVRPKGFFIIMWFYLVFSIIWAGVSSSIVWAMIHDQWHLAKCLLGTWSITTVLTSILDIVFTGLIITDYVNLNTSVGESFLVSYGIVMSVAARGYVLLIINIIFAIITAKLTMNIIRKQNKESTMPIIHGYDANDINPPWFNGSVKDFWASPQQTTSPKTNGGYENRGFERSQSFYNSPVLENPRIERNQPFSNPQVANDNLYNTPSGNIYSVNPASNNINTSNQPTSFSEAIANRTATIGKNKGRRSPLNHVAPPVIPEPDYTPPNSPNGLKSVLRSQSHYHQPLY